MTGPELTPIEMELIAREDGRARLDAAEAADEPFALNVLTARELCELPDPPKSDELLGPLLMRGNRIVLGGSTGEGKTSMALAMIRAVALGEGFLDWEGPGGRALVIDAEQGLTTIKRRVREAGLEQSDRVDYVRVPDGLALDSDTRHIAEVERLLTAGDYSAVLADPLYKLHAGDSNAEREAVDLMRRFDRWREDLRFGLVLPVHLRKPPVGAKFSLNEFFGSSAYLRGCEVALGIQRVSNGYSRLHFLKDRDGDLPIGESWGLLFDQEQGFRRDPDEGAKKPTAKEQIRELLTEAPGLTIERLRTATGYAERTVTGALRELDAVASGYAPKTWTLPDGEQRQEAFGQ